MRLLPVLLIVTVSSAAGHTLLRPQTSSNDGDAMKIAGDFLTLLTSALESADYSKIADYIHDKFQFNGCTKTLNKAQVVGMLMTIPKGSKFSFTLLTARFVDGSIEYNVKISGIMKEFNAFFMLNYSGGKYELKSGHVKNCPKSLNSGDVTELLVKRFLISLERHIERERNIERYIDDDFVFQGCKKRYVKADVVKMVSQLPKGVKPSFRLLNASSTGSVIKYTVEISGFGAKPITARFYLSVAGDYKLLTGLIDGCV